MPSPPFSLLPPPPLGWAGSRWWLNDSPSWRVNLLPLAPPLSSFTEVAFAHDGGDAAAGEDEGGGVVPPTTLGNAGFIAAATDIMAAVIGEDDKDDTDDPAADTDVEVDAELSLDNDMPPDTIAAAAPPDASFLALSLSGCDPKPEGFRDAAASKPVRGTPMGEGEYKPTGARRGELPEGTRTAKLGLTCPAKLGLTWPTTPARCLKWGESGRRKCEPEVSRGRGTGGHRCQLGETRSGGAYVYV